MENRASYHPSHHFRLTLVQNSGGERLAEFHAEGPDATRRLGSIKAGEAFTLADGAELDLPWRGKAFNVRVAKFNGVVETEEGTVNTAQSRRRCRASSLK